MRTHCDADSMRLGRLHRALGWYAAALLLWVSLPGAAWCQETETSELDRWVPAFAVTLDILNQGADGSLQNSLRPPNNPGTPFSGSGSFTEPAVGGSLELMTPALLPILGRPRLFADGNLSAVFSSTVDLEKEGSPGAFEVPPAVVNVVPANGVGGQGSKTSAEIDTLLVSAGAGLAFTIDVGERRLRLKPSFEYIREKVTADGLVNDAECPGGAPECAPAALILTTLSGSGSEAFHGIGAGLELEMDTVRLGPFMLTLFLSGKATQLLGDRKIEFAAGDPDPTTACGSTACWSAEPDRWLYRGGLGLRFRYTPQR